VDYIIKSLPRTKRPSNPSRMCIKRNCSAVAYCLNDAASCLCLMTLVPQTPWISIHSINVSFWTSSFITSTFCSLLLGWFFSSYATAYFLDQELIPYRYSYCCSCCCSGNRLQKSPSSVVSNGIGMKFAGLFFEKIRIDWQISRHTFKVAATAAM